MLQVPHDMRKTISLRRFHKIIAAAIFTLLGTILSPAQLRNTTAVVEQVDAAVKARSESIAGYTVTEHYVVYRNNAEVHPVAEISRISLLSFWSDITPSRTACPLSSCCAISSQITPVSP